LAALAADLGIAADVSFPGFVMNPFAVFARASVFVLSSRFEGLPGVLVQAMACGCPVVSTDCESGPREVLEGGRWGPLVPVGEPNALAEAMVGVLNAPPAKEGLRARAAAFSSDVATAKYAALLDPASSADTGTVCSGERKA
jgi:glycosyltransferase involved in cell wall biosynthesis